MNRTAQHRTAWKSKPVLVGSARERLSLLRDAQSLSAYAEKMGWIKHNPCPPPRPPKGKTK